MLTNNVFLKYLQVTSFRHQGLPSSLSFWVSSFSGALPDLSCPPGAVPELAHGPPDASAVDFKKEGDTETAAVSAFKPLLCSGVQMFKHVRHCLKDK